MKHLRITLLALCLTSLTAQSAQASIIDNITGTAKGAVVFFATILATRGLCSLCAWRAEWRFLDELKAKNTTTDVSQLWPNIKTQILNNHVYYYSYGEYRNYPLLRFKFDLDFYIMTLRVLSISYALSESRQYYLGLIRSLDELNALVVGDYEYIKERRSFERYAPAA